MSWDSVTGLEVAKQALSEAVILPCLRPDLFKGLRAPLKGLLLYGPPGNGKTLLAKALASEAKAAFFSISAASLGSKWHGESERMVRALFRAAKQVAPSVIFIDEVDSLLSSRSSGEHEASKRLKTEFLVQMDGIVQESDGGGGKETANQHVFVLGATNRPWDIDEALRRRLAKRIYVPLPSVEGRVKILQGLLQREDVPEREVRQLGQATEGYSGSDLVALCREAAMGAIRGVRDLVHAKKVRKITGQDFAEAMRVVKPSVDRKVLQEFESFTRNFGTRADAA